MVLLSQKLANRSTFDLILTNKILSFKLSQQPKLVLVTYISFIFLEILLKINFLYEN